MANERDPSEVRPVTLDLACALLENRWPRAAAVVDFGLDSPAHLEALRQPFLNDEITLEQLDGALGNGEGLSALVRSASSNPHKDISFSTSYDLVFGKEQAMSEKIGAGHAAAMGRMGIKELSQALPAFPSHGIQPVEEIGAAGNPTPQEVFAGKSYQEVLDQHTSREPEQGQEMER